MDPAHITIPTAGLLEEEEEDDQVEAPVAAAAAAAAEPAPAEPEEEEQQPESLPEQSSASEARAADAAAAPVAEAEVEEPVVAAAEPTADADMVAEPPAARPSTADAELAACLQSYVSSDEFASMQASTTVLGTSLARCVQHTQGKLVSAHGGDAFSFDSFQPFFRAVLRRLYGVDLYAVPSSAFAEPAIHPAWTAAAKSLRVVAYRNIQKHVFTHLLTDATRPAVEATVLAAAQGLGSEVPVTNVPAVLVAGLTEPKATSAIVSADGLSAVVPLLDEHAAVIATRADGDLHAALATLTSMLAHLAGKQPFAIHPNIGALSSNLDHLRSGLAATVTLALPTLTPAQFSAVHLPAGLSAVQGPDGTITVTLAYSAEPTLTAAAHQLSAALDSFVLLTPAATPRAVTPPHQPVAPATVRPTSSRPGSRAPTRPATAAAPAPAAAASAAEEARPATAATTEALAPVDSAAEPSPPAATSEPVAEPAAAPAVDAPADDTVAASGEAEASTVVVAEPPAADATEAPAPVVIDAPDADAGEASGSPAVAESGVIDADQGTSEEIVALPYREQGGLTKGFDPALLTLAHSYGYNCLRANNVVLLSIDTLVFIAGNILQFVNLKTGEHMYRRSTGGHGIGAIAVHPSHAFYAVGENGPNPVINIFSYPDHALVKVLRKGALEGYASLCFSHKGDKLASVATQPDYVLTVWDWRRQLTELRAKAFSSDVYRVTFNAFNDGQLTTAGAGHIRFWRMATTFTGLKLQGQIGRFGKTEMSDVHGYVEFPDGKVLSSTEWGGLLLWEGGLVKCELSRKGRKPCHLGPVECVYLEEGEIITAGADGTIRLWDFEAIDIADKPSDASTLEVEPMLERKIGPDVHIKSMSRFPGAGTEHSLWLVQDANGSLWRVDLSHSHTVAEPVRLLSFHAGEVRAASACPRAHYMLTAGADGSVRVHDYQSAALVAARVFPQPATAAMWAPLSIDSTGRTMLVGFADGVLRVLTLSSSNDLVLATVVKPHAQALTRISLSRDGQTLATVGDDKAIFLLSVKGTVLEPLGFVEAPGRINSVDWSEDSAKILAACQDGAIYEFAVPKVGQYDTSASFHLEDLAPLRFQVDYAKPVEVVPEKKESKDKKDGDAEEEKKPPPAPEPVKGAVLCAWYSPRGTVLLSMDGTAAGALYECDLGSPKPLAVFPMASDSLAPVVAHAHCEPGHYLLLGAADGTLRVHDESNLMRTYLLSMHDGQVLALAPSFDGSHVVSAGRDGNIFVYRTRLDGVDLQSGALGAAHDHAAVEDIVDPKAYSYEQARQRAELDRRMRTAEDRKMDERRTVRALRKAFEAILKENEALPAEQQLSAEQLELDPALRADIEAQTEARRERVRAEMAWELERSRVGYKKLRGHFIDALSHERFVVKAIAAPEQVSTFRCPIPSSEFKRRASMMTAAANPYGPLHATQKQSIRPSTVLSEDQDNAGDQSQLMATGDMTGGRSRMMAEALKAQQRKQRRKQRQLRWETLMAAKPDESSVDPEDLQAIKDAEENMGDYKLKTSEDYFVPIGERVNTMRKRDQLVALRQRMFDAKCTFNDLVMRLRGRKEKAIQKVAELRGRLQTVFEALGDSLALLPSLPTLDADECPEKRYEYTQADLEMFRERQQQEKDKGGGGGGGFGGFGGFGGAGAGAGAAGAGAAGAVAANGIGGPSSAGDADGSESLALEAEELSPLEQQARAAQRAHLEYERDELLGKINAIIAEFDRDLIELRQIQVDTELRIKSADYRHVLFYQELVHLRVFDKKEERLEERRVAKVDELEQTRVGLKSANVRLSAQTKDLARLTAQEKSVQSQFSAVISDNPKLEKILTKIYKKKLVRSKKNADGDSDSDEDDESEELSEAGSGDEGSSDGEEIDETVCPPGCDPAVYEKIMQLREQRATVEEQLVDAKKNLDALKKDIDSSTKREKTTQTQLAAAEKDITAFQLEKQGRLNELTVAVSLRVHQIKYLANGAFPKDLADAVLFDEHNIDQLAGRIDLLTEEKSMQRKEYKEIKQTQAKMAHDQKRKDEDLTALKKKFEELQMLKFGMLVDLDAMNSHSINHAAEELKVKQTQQQRAHERELQALDEDLVAMQTELTQLTRENTELLHAIATGEQDRRALERSLNSTQRLVTMTTSKQQQTEETLRQLAAATMANKQEAAGLRSEIHRLSRKGGHVLPPGARPTTIEKLPPLDQR